MSFYDRDKYLELPSGHVLDIKALYGLSDCKQTISTRDKMSWTSSTSGTGHSPLWNRGVLAVSGIETMGNTTFLFGCETPDDAIRLLLDLERRDFDIYTGDDFSLYVTPMDRLNAADIAGIRKFKAHLIRLVDNCLALPPGAHGLSAERQCTGIPRLVVAADPFSQPDLLGIDGIKPSCASEESS